MFILYIFEATVAVAKLRDKDRSGTVSVSVILIPGKVKQTPKLTHTVPSRAFFLREKVQKVTPLP